MARLNGKVCLITGGAGGFGREMARLFTAEGGRVVITDLENAAGDAAARETGAEFLVQDVSEEDRWRQVVDHIVDRYGRLDVLINNAGWEGPTDSNSLDKVTLESWRRVQAINVEGVLLGCREAVRAMRKSGGGAIVNLSSIAGIYATPTVLSYGVSKAAVKQLTLSVAKEGVKDRIRCNAIHPGQMDTRMIHSLHEGFAAQLGTDLDEHLKAVFAGIPMGAFGTARDVAYGALYLASDESRYITGTSLVIDGGIGMG